MAQNYECVLLIKPSLNEEAVNACIEQFSKIITDSNGEVVHVQQAGKRRMHYSIQNESEATYAILYFRAEEAGVIAKEFQRQVRINDNLLREMTVKVSELRIVDPARLDAQPFGTPRRRPRPAMAGAVPRRDSVRREETLDAEESDSADETVNAED